MKALRGRRVARPRFPVAGDAAVLISLAFAILVAAWSGRPAPPVPAGPPPALVAPIPVQPGPPREVAVEEAPALLTSAGCPEGCKAPKTGCVIKGNLSFRTGEGIYHVPGGDYYDKTWISPEKGERWFCTEEEAVENGWRKSKR